MINSIIDSELKALHDAENLREKLECRCVLINHGHANKNEYERNESELLRLKTEIQIDQLKQTINQQAFVLAEAMANYFSEIDSVDG